jgi:hypothetical protein
MDMLPALQQKLQLGETQAVLPDAEPVLEGSQKTAPQGAGTPHLNEDNLAKPQHDAREPTVDSHWTGAYTSVSAIIANRQVTQSEAREATHKQNIYNKPNTPLAVLIRKAQEKDP